METDPSPRHPLYPRLLGTAWWGLDEAVRRAHAPDLVGQARGCFRIRQGRGWLARALVRAARMPPPGEAVEVRLVVTRCGPIERWCRLFGETALVTVQKEGPGGLLVERLGGLEFRFRLAVASGALIYRQVSLALGLGPFCLPVPRCIAPQVSAREEPAGRPNQTYVVVQVAAPTGSLLLSYQGSIEREEAAR